MLEAGVRNSDYTFEFSRYIQAGSNSGPRDNDCKFDIHGSVHRRLLNRNTNKMQLCNRIYYSKVY